MTDITPYGPIEQETVPRALYEELGAQAADFKLERDAARRQADSFKAMYENLQERLSNLGDDERQQRLLVILQEDLEKAIRMLLRYAYALGIQQGGILYDEVQALASKYKMQYKPPGDYSYDELTKPVIQPVLEGHVTGELTTGSCSECSRTNEHHPECPNS